MDTQGRKNAKKAITQITVKLNPANRESAAFFFQVENRDRELYPTILSYLNAAVQNLESSTDGSGELSILTEKDYNRIREEVLFALLIYERKKKEERMVP